MRQNTATDAFIQTRNSMAGAIGVMISDRGGRQLDSTPAPIDQIAVGRGAVADIADVI
jgi:isopentenyl diphosphate isomerase/L-lactate dehydrogenase-like FMN-dependent dehydrogenase